MNADITFTLSSSINVSVNVTSISSYHMYKTMVLILKGAVCFCVNTTQLIYIT